MFEFLLEPAAEGLASIAIDIAKQGGQKIGNKVKHVNASRKYIQKYRKTHCELSVLGMRNPVDLATVYTGVKLLADEDTFRFESQAALEESFRETRLGGYSRRHGEVEKVSGISVANEKPYLMVLGGPGAGKSTFLRKVGLEALRTLHYEGAAYRPRLVPVFLELKNFDSDDIDLIESIANSFETCGFPETESFTKQALSQGRLLIILDGLDEVPNAYLDRVLQTIQSFVARYDKNRFIASCRIAASSFRTDAFRRFSKVTMADFDDEQIQQFIGNWFSSEEDVKRSTAEKCWEVLEKPENKASKELAHTPLLLTYLCLVYDRSQRFPNNRSSLYKKALRILLEEWAAEKRILRDDIYEGLSIEQEEILLSEIAYEGMVADQLFFSQKELSKRVRDFLQSNLNAPKQLDSEKVLHEIEVQQGILVERAEDAYSFSHLTLQEYLTAQYLVDNYEWESLIENHLTDSHWREIFLLLPGLLTGKTGADKLLLAMEKIADRYLHGLKLQQLVQWAEISTENSKNTSQPSAKRVAAVFLALARARGRALARDLAIVLAIAHDRALDLAHDLALALDRAFDRALARALDRAYAHDHDDRAFDLALAFKDADVFGSVNFDALIQRLDKLRSNLPTDEASSTEKKQFVEQLYSLWFSALGIEAETTMLSQEESQSLADYFYICELMIRCKEGAVRVSPNVWAGIESRILTVPASS